MVARENRILTLGVGHWQVVNQAHICYPRERGEALDQILLHDQDFSVFRRSVPWSRNPKRLKRRGLAKPWIDLAHRLKTADHQPRTDEQDERQRHLNDGQGIASDIPIAAGTCSAATRAERLGELNSGVLQDRDHAERESRNYRDGKGEQ